MISDARSSFVVAESTATVLDVRVTGHFVFVSFSFLLASNLSGTERTFFKLSNDSSSVFVSKAE